MTSLVEAAPVTTLALEWFKTTADLVKGLAWPLLVLFILLHWKQQCLSILERLPHLIDRMKSGKFGPVEVELEPEQVDTFLHPPVELERQPAELVPRLVDRLAFGRYSPTEIHLVAPEDAASIFQIGEHEIRGHDDKDPPPSPKRR